MSKDLKMEIFASKETVKPVAFHVYEFHTSELYENKFKLIRSAVWKIKNVNTCGVFEDGKYIYTTEKIEEKILNWCIWVRRCWKFWKIKKYIRN